MKAELFFVATIRVPKRSLLRSIIKWRLSNKTFPGHSTLRQFRNVLISLSLLKPLLLLVFSYSFVTAIFACSSGLS